MNVVYTISNVAIKCSRGVSVPLAAGVLLTTGFIPYLAVPVAYAQSSNAAVSQGYETAATDMKSGDLVSLDAQRQGYVQLANANGAGSLIGVVEDRPLLALTNNADQVQVVTGGAAPTLVSDMNGVVRIGDNITASPIDGVGMKATMNAAVIGIAQESAESVKTVALSVTDTYGNRRTVHIGLIPVQIGVTYYTGTDGQASTIIPTFLQRLANAIAGHTVSVARILVSLLIIVLGFVSTIVILYVSVRSSIVSIGRNPLAARAIHKSLLEIVVVTVGILLAMVLGVYAVLGT